MLLGSSPSRSTSIRSGGRSTRRGSEWTISCSWTRSSTAGTPISTRSSRCSTVPIPTTHGEWWVTRRSTPAAGSSCTTPGRSRTRRRSRSSARQGASSRSEPAAATGRRSCGPGASRCSPTTRGPGQAGRATASGRTSGSGGHGPPGGTRDRRCSFAGPRTSRASPRSPSGVTSGAAVSESSTSARTGTDAARRSVSSES